MKISYENDAGRGPGHGLLRCTMDAGELGPEGPCTLVLQRSEDHGFLGQNGWGGQKNGLEMTAERGANGELLLLLEPQIVNQLVPLQNYRATVQPAEGTALKNRAVSGPDYRLQPGSPGRQHGRSGPAGTHAGRRCSGSGTA